MAKLSDAVKTAGKALSGKGFGEDITGYVSNLSMKDDLNALSTELTFTYFKSIWDKYVKDLALEPGMTITLTNNGQPIFIGRIVSVGIDGAVTCYEAGYYLNKSQIVYQATNAKASDVIRAVSEKTGIPVAWIEEITTPISKSWVGSTPSTIISDVLEAAEQANGRKYQYFTRNGQLYVRSLPTTKIWPTYKPADNIADFPIQWAVQSITGSDSIDGMANAIQLVGQDSSAVYTGAIAKNVTSINKYGLLTKVVTQQTDPGDAALKTIVEKDLKDSDQLQASRSVTLWGSDMVMAGGILEFHQPKWKLEGDYRVKSVTHNYERQGHVMTLELTAAAVIRSTSGEDSTKVYGLPDDLGQSSESSSGSDGTSTGNGSVESFISAAESLIGWSEKKAGNANAMYPKGKGTSGVNWCGWFVDWCARQAGVSTTLIPDTGSSQEYMATGKRRGKWHPHGSYQARRGDIVVWSSGGGHGHVGIMTSSSQCICGNTGRNMVESQKLWLRSGSLSLSGFYSWWE